MRKKKSKLALQLSLHETESKTINSDTDSTRAPLWRFKVRTVPPSAVAVCIVLRLFCKKKNFVAKSGILCFLVLFCRFVQCKKYHTGEPSQKVSKLWEKWHFPKWPPSIFMKFIFKLSQLINLLEIKFRYLNLGFWCQGIQLTTYQLHLLICLWKKIKMATILVPNAYFATHFDPKRFSKIVCKYIIFYILFI